MTDHMPHFYRNPKADESKPYPPPERYGLMAVLVVAATILAVSVVMWHVYNPRPQAEWVAR